MEKPEGWSSGHDNHKDPRDRALLQTKLPADSRSLNRHTQPLQNEISSRQAVSSPSRQRNHQVMNQARCDEHQQPSHGHARAPVKRTKNQIVSQLPKSKIPALSPELAQRFRQNRLR